MVRHARFLVVLAAGTRKVPPCWRPGAPGGRFVLVRGRGLAEAIAAGPRFDAILVEVEGDGRAGPEYCDVKRLSRGAPVVPFRLEGGVRRGSRASAAAGQVVLPIARNTDARLLEILLDRDKRIAEQRRRGRRAAQRAREARARMRALTDIVRLTGSELDPHRIIEVVMEKVGQFFDLRAWVFLLADAEQESLKVERAGGEGMGAMKGKRFGIAEGMTGRAAQRRQTVILEDAGAAGMAVPGLPESVRFRSVMAVPLLSRGRLIGVLVAAERLRSVRFSAQDARLMSLLLEPAAVAIDNALLLKKSEELSITDDLTKLYNSRYLNATLRREVERSKRYRMPVSLIFLDLDGFKSVNDQHGHLWGSRTLVEVGRVIGATVREIDIVSRFGGDEFTVILPQTGPEGAAIIAERIRQKIAETSFLASYGMDVRLTASLGIASFPDHGRSKDDLLARADQAMYLVKGGGKNGVALAEPERPRPAAASSGG